MLINSNQRVLNENIHSKTTDPSLFPTKKEDVPDYIAKKVIDLVGFYTDLIAYLGIHQGKCTAANAFTASWLSDQILGFFEALFDGTPEEQEILSEIRNELVKIEPNLKQMYTEAYEEFSKFQSGECYKESDDQKLNIILPPSMILPHHVIFVNESDRVDTRSIKPGHLVAYWTKNQAQEQFEDDQTKTDETNEQTIQETNQDDSNSEMSLLCPKSLCIGIVKQILFSSQCKPSVVFQCLTAQPNISLQTIDSIDPNMYSKQLFENMRPIMNSQQVSEKEWPLSAEEKVKRLQIPQPLEEDQQKVLDWIKTNQYSKFMYFRIAQLQFGEGNFSFLPVMQNNQYSTPFLGLLKLGNEETIQGLRVNALLDPFEDLLCYQLRAGAVVLAYDSKHFRFYLARVILGCSRATRFHVLVQPIRVDKNMLKQRLENRGRKKKSALEVLKELTQLDQMNERISKGGAGQRGDSAIVFAKFVIPVTVESWLLEDCLDAKK